MKREYFALIFIYVTLAILVLAGYFIGEEQLSYYLTRFFIVVLIATFYAGQYSMKLPKKF